MKNILYKYISVEIYQFINHETVKYSYKQVPLFPSCDFFTILSRNMTKIHSKYKCITLAISIIPVISNPNNTFGLKYVTICLTNKD